MTEEISKRLLVFEMTVSRQIAGASHLEWQRNDDIKKNSGSAEMLSVVNLELPGTIVKDHAKD